MNISRRTFLAGSMTAAAGSLVRLPSVGAAQAGDSGVLAGINLAGADFGTVPGTHGTEYLYPTPENFDYYHGLGFRLVRLPFKWERLQPEPFAPFAASEQDFLQRAVAEATGRGMTLVLDPHNFAKRRLSGDSWANEHIVGSERVPAEMLYDFWARLARLFGGDGILFGLMNEPVGLDAEAWLPIVDGTIAAIRGAGADNLILVPGVEYTGAHSWAAVRNTVMGGATDPLGRIAFEVHQYFDANSSGTAAESVSGTIGAERIETFQEWARAHGHKAFLGEFGAGDDPASLHALADICAEMDANPDVWLGWAAWAGGPRWPDDNMHTLEPHAGSGRERAQTSVLKAFARPGSGRAAGMPGAVFDVDLARGRALGVEDAGEILAVARSGEAYAARRSGSLDPFAADTPRITDLGLLIEEERRNLFQAPGDLRDPAWKLAGRLEPGDGPAPLDEAPALRLREERGLGWCALMQPVEFPGAGDFVASVHARHLSRRWLTIRGDRPSSAHGAFDVEDGTGTAAGGEAGHAGHPWGWQRLALAWRTDAGGLGEIAFSLQDAQSNSAPFERTGAATGLWGPMLEAGRFATSYHPGSRAQDVVSPRGSFAALLGAPERTVVIELRDLPPAAIPCEILSAGTTALLRRTESGALRCELGGGAETDALEAGAWRRRIKVAVALSTAGRTATIAATGASPVACDTELPDFGPVLLGSRGAAALNGRVTRIVGFDRALGASELAASVA